MIARTLIFLVSFLAAWVLVCLPARALMDADGFSQTAMFSGTALLVCLVPALVTLLWSRAAIAKSPEAALTAFMGGTGFRLFGVLLAGWGLTKAVPYFDDFAFWYWLLGAYLFTLALEVALVLSGKPDVVPAPRPAGDREAAAS